MTTTTPSEPLAESGLSAVEGYFATLQHISLLRRKRDQIQAALTAAEEQHLHRIGVAYAAGNLDMEDLWTAFAAYRDIADKGFTRRWDRAISVSAGKIKWHPWRRSSAPGGAWSGCYPFGESRTPGEGISVVYVLFDEANVPCYVGSTEHFRTRLAAHWYDGKRFGYWHAYPCADRQSAYDLETQLLKQHKPYLNKKAAA